MNPTDPLVDISTVLTWPQATVAVFMILCVLVVPQIGAWIQARRSASAVNDVKKTLTTNNGGSHVKDSLDRIERNQAEQGHKLDTHIEEARMRDERIAALEAAQMKKRSLFRIL